MFIPPLTAPVLKHTSSYTLTPAYPVQAWRQLLINVAKVPPAGASHEIAVAVSAEIAVAVASPAESGIIHIHHTPIDSVARASAGPQNDRRHAGDLSVLPIWCPRDCTHHPPAARRTLCWLCLEVGSEAGLILFVWSRA